MYFTRRLTSGLTLGKFPSIVHFEGQRGYSITRPLDLTILDGHLHHCILSTSASPPRRYIFLNLCYRIAQEIYTNLGKNDLLVKQEKEQTYCEGCQKYVLFFFLIQFILNYDFRFLADRFVEGICPHCGYEDARGDQCDGCSRTLDAIELVKPRCLVDKTHVVTSRMSAHMYLRLDTIQPRTEEWVKLSWQKGKWSPNSVINSDGELIDARLKSGLLPTPLTRDLKWGVPVPIDGEDVHGMAGKVLCKSASL